MSVWCCIYILFNRDFTNIALVSDIASKGGGACHVTRIQSPYGNSAWGKVCLKSLPR